MRFGPVPPAAIGLAAGLITSAAVLALGAAGLLPESVSTPLLVVAGGLAAGLAAPVRTTIGAVLGGATGFLTAMLLTIVFFVQMASVPSPYFSSPPFALIAGASVIMFTPLNTAAGAVGAAVRPLLVGLRSAPAERTAERALERRQWAGIAAGALCIVVGNRAWVQMGVVDPAPALLVAGFAGGFVAGILSTGGARAGAGSGLLAGVLGLGAVALYFIWQASASPATGDGVPEGLWPIAVAIMAFWVLPAVALGGALGGSFRKPPVASAEPHL